MASFNLNKLVQKYVCSDREELTRLKHFLLRVPVSVKPFEGMDKDDPFLEFMVVAELAKPELSSEYLLSRCDPTDDLSETEMVDLEDKLPGTFPRIRINRGSSSIDPVKAYRKYGLERMFLPEKGTMVFRVDDTREDGTKIMGTNNAIAIVWKRGDTMHYIEIGMTDKPLYDYPL